ncbi:MAG: 28S ribosomal protein S5, mitochondrial [Caeruleum heppii]|nr:MAG: 28S ribosomal protein S5, mitochondrial [Caeruleum heppii]
MKSLLPSRCLLCRIASNVPRSRPSPSRPFHTTTSSQSKRRSSHPSIKASDLGLTTNKSDADSSSVAPYTDKDREVLSKLYSPDQLRAIEAAESAISPDDLTHQAVIRNDPFVPDYLDDFATRRTIIDKRARKPETDFDPHATDKTEADDEKDLTDYVRNYPIGLPDDEARLHYIRFLEEKTHTHGDPAAELNASTAKAPELPLINDAMTDGLNAPTTHGATPIDPALEPILQQTSFTADEVSNFRIKDLVAHRVVNQTRLGKIQSMYFLTVAGDGNGLLGIGEGKGTEPEDARQQSRRQAIKNMKPIVRYEGRTVFGESEAKVGASIVRIASRPPGFGIRTQRYIYEMCRCAGISDISAKVIRSRNPMNVAKATYEALMRQRLPEDVARARGKKFVDVRKVYYGGLV